MKHLLALLVLTVSVGAMAQQEERVVLNQKEVSVGTERAILVRTAQTPDKVVVTFKVPMANSFCDMPVSNYVHRICSKTENVYRTERVCRQVPVASPNPYPTNSPRGPRYNPGTSAPRTNTICTMEQVYAGTVNRAYDCSYYNNYCGHYSTTVGREDDSVKIKFKNLPNLGGSEEETFRVAAKQRNKDGENVVYDIEILSTVENREYEVKSKGLFGFDSYVIESK